MNKYVLSLIGLFFASTFATAQEFEVETVSRSGEDDQRINLVFLPDGYQASELPKFKRDVQGILTQLFNTTPFKEYKNYFNVHIVYVPSNVSGASRDPNNLIDNYFGSTYFYADIERLLVPSHNDRVASVLADNFPTYDQAFVLVNDDKYGGSGGWLATSSTNALAGEIAIHEIGHSFAGLSDEYWAGPQFARETPNMTQQTDETLVKWKNWIGTNAVGIFSHTGDASWKRPHRSCKMELLGTPFCAVCRETFIETFYRNVSIIQSHAPSDDANIRDQQSFSATSLNPNPYSLESFWLLGTDTVARDESAFTLDMTSLSDGNHTLSLNIADFTVLSRKNNLAMDVVNWSITKNGNEVNFNTHVNRRSVDRNDFIGLEEPGIITSIDDDFVQEIQFKAFPNPVGDQLSISFFNPNPAPFTLQVISMDGRVHQAQKQELLLPGEQEFMINTSDLTSGMFLIQMQIGSKLVIKKILK